MLKIFFYDIIYIIAFVFYLPVLLVRGKLHGGFKQRFSFLDDDLRYRLSQKKNIWIHAVSVGEVLAVVGLVDKLRLAHPEHQIVVSCVTPTGHTLARKRFPKTDIIIFAPLDLSWVVSRFVSVIRPEIFIAVETEIWPNLLISLAKVDVPLVMVNGRISDRSYYQYLRFKTFFREVLRPFRAFCMQSARDADRVIAIGAAPQAVSVLGSMKFDDVSAGEAIDPSRIGLTTGALVWVAGSTHPGEEKILLDIFKKLKKTYPTLSLVIAPRHVDRANEICELVKESGLTFNCFSNPNHNTLPPVDVVVVDTVGHLRSFYRIASIVFVGKSLVGAGGQNIIEPAFFGKPIVVGPNMQNFTDITETFLEARAILQVQDAAGLEEAVNKILSSSELRDVLGERASATVKKNQGATLRTQSILTGILNSANFVKPI